MVEMRLLNKTTKTIEIEFPEENDTLLNLLKDRLLRDGHVVTATYLTGHPFLDKPRLHVEVSDGKPEQKVKEAAKELRAVYDDFETQFLKG